MDTLQDLKLDFLYFSDSEMLLSIFKANMARLYMYYIMYLLEK